MSVSRGILKMAFTYIHDEYIGVTYDGRKINERQGPERLLGTILSELSRSVYDDGHSLETIKKQGFYLQATLLVTGSLEGRRSEQCTLVLEQCTSTRNT